MTSDSSGLTSVEDARLTGAIKLYEEGDLFGTQAGEEITTFNLQDTIEARREEKRQSFLNRMEEAPPEEKKAGRPGGGANERDVSDRDDRSRFNTRLGETSEDFLLVRHCVTTRRVRNRHPQSCLRGRRPSRTVGTPKEMRGIVDGGSLVVFVPKVLQLIDCRIRRFFLQLSTVVPHESEDGGVGDDHVMRVVVPQVEGLTRQEEGMIPGVGREGKVSDRGRRFLPRLCFAVLGVLGKVSRASFDNLAVFHVFLTRN
jgi:hypothetical protein